MLTQVTKSLIKSFIPSYLLERHSKQRWYEHKQQVAPTISEAIHTINERWTDDVKTQVPEVSPIFLLASEWRSGSTLIQRLINSDSRVLMWGEPYGDCNLIQRLADSIRPLRTELPTPNQFINHFTPQDGEHGVADLSRAWIANLYPEMRDFLQAHRTFFEALFATPAYSRGYSRWGIKEVRLTIEHAEYLHWLFPKAKFIFLYRNPYKAYRSCRPWRNLYMRWPDVGIDTATKFGQTWQQLVNGYIQGHTKVNGMLVQYEALCTQKEMVDKLSTYLELDLKPEILDEKVTGVRKKRDPVPPLELKELELAVDPLARKLCYEPPYNAQ